MGSAPGESASAGGRPNHLRRRMSAERQGTRTIRPSSSATTVSAKALAPDTPVRDAAAALLTDAFEHFRTHVQALHSNASTESVHQMRIGLRRMRAVATAFRPALDAAVFRAWQEPLKELFARLGDVRAADVFRSETLPLAAAGGVGPEVCAALDRAAGAFRRHALGRAQAAFKQAAVQATMGSSAAMIEATTGGLRARTQSIGAFAAKRLPKLRKRLMRAGRKARTSNTPDAWHRARIAVKRLRYASVPLLPVAAADAAAAAKYAKRLARLQERLGMLNDVWAAPEFVAVLAGAEGREASQRRTEQAINRWAGRQVRPLTAKVRKALQRFRETPLPELHTW